MKKSPNRVRVLRGGKDKGGGGSPSTPKEDINDLRSKSYARSLDLLGYGEWEGIVRSRPGVPVICDIEAGVKHIGASTLVGLNVGDTVEGFGIPRGAVIVSTTADPQFFTIDKDPFATGSGKTLLINASDGSESIFFDETPLTNDDGSANFTGIKWAYTPGLQDQGYITGFDTIENYVGVGVKVKRVAPVVRTITNSEADKLIVQVRIPSLVMSIQSTGDRIKSTIQLNVYVKLNSGDFELVKNWVIYGKCLSDYLEETEFTLPRSLTPESDSWQVKLERVTNDHEGSVVFSDATYWESYTEVITRRFRYPNMSMLALEADSENFSKIPVRAARVRMKKLRIPTNYDPVTRTYATTGPGTSNGGWDGTYKVAYSNNPAWVNLDLLSDPNYGAARYLPNVVSDKWSLYEISKYCDRMVPDGFGGMEPLFTANLYLSAQEAAEKVLSDVASIARVMIYYGRGMVNYVQDRPKESFTEFNNSSCKDGKFYYTSTALKARKTVLHVRWNDPDDFYRMKVQPVEDAESILRYGWNEKEAVAIGCTSRGQAVRYGRLTLNTEKLEYDAVKWTVGLEGQAVKPGMIVDIFDHDRQFIENEGRVSFSSSTTVLTLDKPVLIESGKTYKLTLVVPKQLSEVEDITDSTQTGTLETKQLEERTVATTPGTVSELVVTSAYSVAPTPGTVWILSSNTLAPQKIRVISVEESAEGSEYTIGGNRYTLSKYDESERDPNFEEPPIFNYPTTNNVPRVRNLALTPRTTVQPEGAATFIDVSWSAPLNYSYAKSYRVYWSFENGPFIPIPEMQTPGCSFKVDAPGLYVVRVTTVSAVNGATSVPEQAELLVDNLNPINDFKVTGLELYNQGNDLIFSGKDAHFVWRLNSPARQQELGSETHGAQDGITDPYFNYFRIRIKDSNGSVVFEDRTLSPFYVYTFEQNRLHGSTAFAAPYRQFTLGVAPVDKYNVAGVESKLTVSNPSPALPTLTMQELIGAVNFKFSFPNDSDFRGYRIWASTSNGFSPSDANLVYDGPDSQPTLKLTAGTLFYIRYAAYDAFGLVGINVSDQLTVVPLVILDTIAPAVPTGLAVTSVLVSQPDGTQIVKLVLTWDANTEEDFMAYEWQIRETSGAIFDWSGGTALGKTVVRAEIYGRPNMSYTARIRAADRDSNFSAYSAEVVYVSTKDTTPPGIPIWGTCFSAFRNNYLSWTNPTDDDFAGCDLYENTVNNFATATLIRKGIRAESEVLALPSTGVFVGQTRYYWLIARDTSENSSTVSAVQSVVMSGVPVPTGLTVTSVVDLAPDGTQVTYLLASVDAPTFAEFGAFTWEVNTPGDVIIWRGTSAVPNIRIPIAGNISVKVKVRMDDHNNGRSDYTAETTLTTAKDTTPPAVPGGFGASSSMGKVFLYWNLLTELDWNKISIFRATTNVKPSTPYQVVGRDTTWTDDNITQGVLYYYWLTAGDTSGNDSAATSSVSAAPGQVQTTDLANFAVDATKMFNHTIILSGDTWTDNSPTAGLIAWNAHTVYYKGSAYSIAAGNTNLGYVYWNFGDTAYTASATNPTLTDGQFMIATNVSGAHDLAWNAIANAVIGTAYIQNLAVTNAKILSLTVDKLTAGTITSQEIIIAGGSAGIIRSSNYSAGTAGWHILADGTAEFNSVTVRGLVTGSSISIGSATNDVFKVDTNGNIWCGNASFASAPFRVSNTGILTASSAVITGSIEASSLKIATLFVIGATSNTTNSSIQSFGFTTGSVGWRILGDGSAEFNSITVRNSLIVSGTFGSTSVSSVESGANRATSTINSSNQVIGVVKPTTALSSSPSGSGLFMGNDFMGYFNTTWKTYMDSSGNFFFKSGSNILQWNGTALSVSSATPTYNNSNTAIWLGADGTVSFKDKFVWNGTTLSLTGTVTATAGTIGGFTLGTTYLTANSGINEITIDNNGPEIRIGSASARRVSLRKTFLGDPAFSVYNSSNVEVFQVYSETSFNSALFTMSNASGTPKISMNSLNGTASFAGQITASGNLNMQSDILMGSGGSPKYIYDCNGVTVLKNRSTGYSAVPVLSNSQLGDILRYHGLCD